MTGCRDALIGIVSMIRGRVEGPAEAGGRDENGGAETLLIVCCPISLDKLAGLF
jgi:hypothetical protein